nr:DDE-type integrase/transposase/recombinase [Brevundimonas subvibrioides]
MKRRRPHPSPRWPPDEEVCRIGGKRMLLWRAVDDEGEVVDVLVQRRRDTEAALKLPGRLLHNQPVKPRKLVTDGQTCRSARLRLHSMRRQRLTEAPA